MDASAFWNVIGRYNSQTWQAQCALLVLLLAAAVWSYARRNVSVLKCALGAVHLFIAAAFFGLFGTEPVQKFFALPLFLAAGILFLHEGVRVRGGPLEPPGILRGVLLLLWICYPLISVLLGGRFPRMVTHIMPCPAASAGIVLYSCCRSRNRLLLALLVVWGLTGVKAVFVRAWEDLILLACGLYGAAVLARGLFPAAFRRRDF